MRVVIAGQGGFGESVYRATVAAGHEVAAVSAPRARRSCAELPDRLRNAAEVDGVPWIPAGALRARAVPEDVDLIVAAHAHDFIGRPTRRATRLGAIGYHPSLLPLHRGRDAIRWALRFGDRVTGGTVYWLDERVDGGDVAAQEWAFVRPGDTARELWRRDLAPIGVRLILRVLEDLERGVVVAVPQDEALATWEPSIGRPPLHRPELVAIGPGPAGYTVERRASALRR